MGFLSNYQVSWKDLSFSAITLGTGFPYAKRHYELSQSEPNWIAHRMIAVVEAVPFIGAIAALIERIAYAFFGSDAVAQTTVQWRDRAIELRIAQRIIENRMRKNLNKARDEHEQPFPDKTSSPYPFEASNFLYFRPNARRVIVSHHTASAQGPRDAMEDAHFYQKMENGTLTGVFDGHGGSEVAIYASDQIQTIFPLALKKANGNVHKAFESVIAQTHQEVAKNSKWNSIGSTAVICYIDHKTNQIYTATLGDSEANIYRKNREGRLISLPLSCIRNWLSKKDLNRLKNHHGATIVDYLVAELNGQAKHVRSQLFGGGVNVSRAIGDVANAGRSDAPLVIQKPKITIALVQPDDVLVLACDGLKDYVREQEIIEIIDAGEAKPSLAQQLVNHALERMTATRGDNITVITLGIS